MKNNNLAAPLIYIWLASISSCFAPANKKSSPKAAFTIGLLRILFLHDRELATAVLCVLFLCTVCTTVNLRLALAITLA